MQAITNPDHAAVQRSFDRVTLESDEFAELFYECLFADYPEVVPLFQNVELARQQKKLFAMMTLVVSHLDQVEVVHPLLTELGRRHVDYRVIEAFYHAFVETFLKTLSETLQDEWSDVLAAGWRAALWQISEVMIEAGAQKREGSREAPSDDIEVLMEISGKSQVSGAHSRLFTSFLGQKMRDHDLEIARDVQRTLLPDTLDAPDGYSVRAIYEPAREVGGDYYDCFAIPGGRMCVAFGDVAGKGVAAAMVMARLSSAIQATVPLTPGLGEAMASVNDHMCQRAWGGRFVTLLGVLLDPVRHQAQLVNAGHRAPLLRRANGSVEEFAPDIAGVPIGILAGVEYPVADCALEPGDLIVLFTDGIDEARSPSGAFYGIDRLRTFIENAPRDCETLGQAILEDVHTHSAGRPASDDIAIVTIARDA